MDKADIRKILEMVRGRRVAEITVGVDGSHVRLAVPRETALTSPEPKRDDPSPQAQPAGPAQVLVRAPMVGIFRRTDGTPAPGERAEPGAVVGEIESMGLRNDIVCEIGGTVIEAFVEDGRPVEYGQPIIAVAVEPAQEVSRNAS